MSDNNPDLRERVTSDRGILKKLQLIVPGLREYRILEDIRAADQLLRKQVFDKLIESKAKLEGLRNVIVAKGDLSNLSVVGTSISQLQQIAGEVLHSQQGSAGISPNIRIDESVLNKLYEYDYNFVNTANQLFQVTSNFISEYNSGTTIQSICEKTNSIIEEFRHAWKTRLESVEKILVTK